MLFLIINIDNFDINYIVEGEGSPILLLHGWGSSIVVWRNIINYLKNRYTLYALDFPGCGGSSMPKAPLDLNDYNNLVIEFCKKLNIIDPIIMGHSHGGRVALSLMANNLLSFNKAILFDSAGIIAKKSLKTRFKIKTFKFCKKVLTLPIIKNYTERTLNALKNYFGSNDYSNAPDVMKKTLVNVVNVDLRKELSNITVSTLLIWGDKDTDTPLNNAKLIEELIPDCGLCVLKGCGHFALIEKPYEVNAILNSFLG